MRASAPLRRSNSELDNWRIVGIEPGIDKELEQGFNGVFTVEPE
jgi:hypothetical protein